MVRPSHLRRIARGTVAGTVVLAVLAVLVLGGVTVVNLPGVRLWIARRAAAELGGALGLPARIGDVRVSLAPPRLVARRVEIGPQEAPLVTANVAEVALGRIKLAERLVVVNQLRLGGVRVRGRLPRGRLGGRGEGWVAVKVRQLELEDVQIAELKLPGEVTIRARQIDARWSGSSAARVQAAVLHVSAFTVTAPGIESFTGSLEAWGRQGDAGLELRRIRARGPGWRLSGDGSLEGAAAHVSGEATVDLAALDAVVRARVGLAGEAHVAWDATLAMGATQVEARVEADAIGVAGFTFDDVEGEALVSGEGIEASLHHARLAGGGVTGTYTLDDLAPPWSHRVSARGDDLSLAAFLTQIGVPSAGLAGRCRASAEVAWHGTSIAAGYGAAVATVVPAAGDVPVAGRLTFDLAADGGLRIASEGLRVDGAPVRWGGRMTLVGWEPTWSIAGEGVQVATVARLLEGWVGAPVLPRGLSGETAFGLELTGPFSDLAVDGTVAVAPAIYGSLHLDEVRGRVTVAGGAVRFDDATGRLGAGRVSAEGRITSGEPAEVELYLTGDALPAATVLSWTGLALPVKGTMGVTGTCAGALSDPDVEARVDFTDIEVAGVPFGAGEAQARVHGGVATVRRLRLGPLTSTVELDLGRRQATVDARLERFALDRLAPLLARLAGDELTFDLHGTFPFDQPTGRLHLASAAGARGTVELDHDGLVVALERPGVWRLDGAIAARDGGHSGEFDYELLSLGTLAADLTDGKLALRGAAGGRATLEMGPGSAAVIDGTVTHLHTVVQDDVFDLLSPARFTVRGGDVELSGVELGGSAGALRAALRRHADGTLTGGAEGRVPVSLLGLLWPDSRLAGLGQLRLTVSGDERHPQVVGSAMVEEGSVLLPAFPAPLTHVNGAFEFVAEAVRLRDVTFSLGGGNGRAEGRIGLVPAVELDLRAALDGVQWPVLEGLDPWLSGEVRIVGPLEALVVSGTTTLQRTVFREEINLQRLVLQEVLGPERAATTDEGATRLNLQVAVPSTLEIDTPLVRATLRGDLRVVGTTARTGLLGRLETLPGGEVELYGQVYELDRATVTFSDPDRINPYLDLSAHAWVQSVEITIGLLGTLDRLTPNLVSNPPLPQTDLLALISTGRRADQATQAQAGALAGSFLAEQLAGAVTRRARTLLDVDQLRVDPFAATETGSPTARVTVVKQLSRDWTVTVSTNLAANREEVIQSRWRLGPGIYLQASRDIDGSYSMEVKWQRRY